MEYQNIMQSDRRPDQYNMNEYLIRLACLARAVTCTGMSAFQRDIAINAILAPAFKNLLAHHERDPSVRHQSVSCLASPYSTFFAILAYRIAYYTGFAGTYPQSRGPRY